MRGSREWDRWDQVKGFLTGWKKVRGVSTDVPLPTDKLACRMPKGKNFKQLRGKKAPKQENYCKPILLLVYILPDFILSFPNSCRWSTL